MDINLKERIVAIVAADCTTFSPGAVPVFFVKEDKEKEDLALLLAKMTNSMAHEITKGVYLIVKR